MAGTLERIHEAAGLRFLAAALVPLGLALLHVSGGLVPAAVQPSVLLVLVVFSALLGGVWIGLFAAALMLIHALWLLADLPSEVDRLFALPATGDDTPHLLTYLVAAPAAAVAAGLYRQMMERRRQLTSREKFTNTIFEQAGVAIAYSDLSGQILRCNRMYSELVGRNEDEVVGMNFKDLVDPRDREENWTLSRQLLAGDTASFTLVNRYLRKDGVSVWSRKIVTLLRDAGGAPTHLLLFATDISDEMALRADLEQSEANYRALWESAGNANFLVFVPNFRIEQANAAALRFFGAKDHGQLAAMRFADLSPERQDDGELSTDKEQRLLAVALREEEASFEWQFRSLAGKEAYASVNLTRVEVQGRVGLQCSAVDITDRVQLTRHQADARRMLAEEVNNRTAELEDLTYELHLAQSVGGMGSFSVDLLSGTFSCSPETARILNLDDFDRIELGRWTEKVHPDDLPGVMQAWERGLAGAPFNATYRIVSPEGVRHVKAGVRFKRDSEGKAVSAIGALLDLTRLLATREQNVLKGYRGRVDGLLAATAAVQADTEQNTPTDTRRLAQDLLRQFPDWSSEEIDAVIEQAIMTIKAPLRARDT